MTKKLKKSLPNNMKTTITSKESKFLIWFPVKGLFFASTKIKHHYSVGYVSKCHIVNCKKPYAGETVSRIAKRIINQNKRDKIFHILQHFHQIHHNHVEKTVLRF